MHLEIDGSEVFVATGGRPFDAELPAVVMIHGAGMDHTVWSLQARYFAYHGRSVAAVDLPAHGRSAGTVLDSIDALADWTQRLFDALQVETVALAGHSMGAAVTLETAGRYPDRVRALALLGAGERIGVHPDLLAAAEAGDHLAIDLITDWGFGHAGHFGGHSSPGLWMMDGGVRLLERSREGVLHADLAATAAYEGALEAAANVRCPTLMVMGEGDRMVPPDATRMVGAFADCRTVVFEDCGHMMMIERPDATTDALRQIV